MANNNSPESTIDHAKAMQHTSDHDILIALSTKVDIFINELKSKANESELKELKCQVNRLYSWVWGLVVGVLLTAGTTVITLISTRQ